MTIQGKITQIILECAPADMTTAQIKLMAAKLVAVVDEAVSHKDSELKSMWDKWPEPVNYVSTDGLLLLPDNIRDKLGLRQGGGVSFMPNKDTGRFELWTIDEVDKWFSGEGEPDNKYPFAVAPRDGLAEEDKYLREDDPTLQISLSEIYPSTQGDTPSYNINGVAINASENSVRVIAMADGLYMAHNGKLSKMETKPDLYKDDRYKIEGLGDDAFGVHAVYHPPIEQVYSDDFTPSDKHPLDQPSKESLRKMAELGVYTGYKPQRPIIICYGNDLGDCYGNDIDDMFMRYDDEHNHWFLHNWRGVDGLSDWLEEVSIKLGINIVISDDSVWCWRNGKRDKIVYDYNGEKITLEESVSSDTIRESTIKPSEKEVSC